MELTKKYLINGPNNIIRLTNGEKIIYIFGDIHLDINNQTECIYDKNFDSINIDQFLLKFMKENIIDEYDLFIEDSYNELINRSNYINKSYDTESIYINNIKKIFIKNMNFADNNKIIKSTKYPNFRFHYFDFRDNFSQFEKIINLCNNFPEFHLILKNIDDILNILNLIKLEINDFYKLINENSQNKYIKKIYTKYKNNKIKKQILFIIDNYYKTIFYNRVIDTIEDLLDYIYTNYDTINNKYLSIDYKIELMVEIAKKINIISRIFYDVFQLSDIYLIRRILDKKYNKKSIIYTGLAHTSLIIYFLINYFDFTITNIYYLSNNFENIQKFEEYIKTEKKYNTIIDNLFHTNDYNQVIQCVNLFDFPINFS